MQVDEKCTCDDTSQNEQYICRECKQEKFRPLSSHERVANCQVHCHQIAVCYFDFPSGASLGPICDSCQPDQRF